MPASHVGFFGPVCRSVARVARWAWRRRGLCQRAQDANDLVQVLRTGTLVIHHPSNAVVWALFLQLLPLILVALG